VVADEIVRTLLETVPVMKEGEIAEEHCEM
jgi:hypothetical protein